MPEGGSMKRDTVLVVDDIEINRLLLQEIFKDMYNVIHASNGIEALDAIRKDTGRIAAIVLDLEMPVMNGFEFLKKFNLMPDGERIPVIVVTVDDTNSSQLKVLDYGVSDIIKKPYHPTIVLKRVKNAVNLFAYKEELEHKVRAQGYALEEKERELDRVNESLIDALSSIVEFRDLETGEHVQRIKDYTRVLCYSMVEKYPECGIDPEQIDYIVRASAMHDIGKIAIPDAILLKPGRLTPEEFDVIKTHTLKGGEILDKVGLLNNEEYLTYCRNICLSHHEKYDGKGYPMGLKGENIPIEAQIVSIADVFDALVSKRVYKDAYTIEETVNMIKNGECGEFSERIMDCFVSSLPVLTEIAMQSHG